MRTILSMLLFCGGAYSQVVPAVNSPTSSFPGYVLLGKLAGANFNSTADQAIAVGSGTIKYIIKDIVVVNASTSLTLAVGGFYAAANKTTAIVANTQLFSALTASSKYVSTTLNALVGTDVRTETTLYLSLTTGQGGAATADVYIFGEMLP